MARIVNHPGFYSVQALVAEGARVLGAHGILVEEQTAGFHDAAFGFLIVPEGGE